MPRWLWILVGVLVALGILVLLGYHPHAGV